MSRIEELLKELKAEMDKENVVSMPKNGEKVLVSFGRGKKVRIAGRDWIVLSQADGKTACVAAKCVCDHKFDENTNNLGESELFNDYLNGEFLVEIEAAVGAENIHTFNTDLTAMDGLKGYKDVVGKVSLLTFDLYRENRDILEVIDDLWFLANPYSMPEAGYSRGVCCVGSSGAVGGGGCGYSCGVRPFCIFSSDIFVSECDEKSDDEE